MNEDFIAADKQDIFELVKILQRKAFDIAVKKNPMTDEKRLELALGLLNAVDNLYMADTSCLFDRKL